MIESAEQVNQLTKNRIIDSLARTLQQHPAADLTNLLEEHARAYAHLRLSLAALSQKKGNARGAESESGGSDGFGFPIPCCEDDEVSSILLKDGAINVDYALDARILRLAFPDHPEENHAQRTVPSFPTEGGLSEKQFAAGLDTAFQHGEILWRLFETVVIGLGPSVVVKVGISLDPDGITNLQYINDHVPSVPAPSFLGSISCGRWSYVFMSRGRGVTLESMWPDLSTDDKLGVQMQLSVIFRNLRCGSDVDETPKAPHLGSFSSTICKDTRRNQRVSAVPIDSEGSFNDFLVEAPPRRTTPASVRMLRPSMRDDHAVVMTHADLHPRNIMAEWVTVPGESGGEARKQCVITSILDWEMAGWYPAYWEFVKALCNASPRGPLADWPTYLPTDAIGTWPVEYALDSLIGRWLG